MVVERASEVCARFALLAAGIFVVHPGLKERYQIRSVSVPRRVLIEESQRVRVGGHVVVVSG